MSQEHIRPVGFGFIPKRLEIPGRPELSDFPLNILFVNFFLEKGKKWAAEALYEPDLETYLVTETGKKLVYPNVYNQARATSTVTITRHDRGWVGEKAVNGARVRLTLGPTWEQFFGQLTISGLVRGEPCRFEKLAPHYQDL